MIDPRALTYARAVLTAHLDGEPLPPPPEGDEFEAAAGAFVTVRRAGALRGCLGDVSFSHPFGEVLQRMTVAALRDDPRFPPVTRDELPELLLEISRLTPPRPAGRDEIEVGRHGVIVSAGSYRGLLLPQVATEFGCDAEGFLELTCEKAGLPRDAACDPDLTIEVFEAEVLAE